jgi:hypothetical protein
VGKYDAMKGKLPQFQQEPSFQAKVDEIKSQYQALDAPELARIYSLERVRKKDFEEQIADLNVGLEAISQLLVDQMEAGGLMKFSLASGETCFQQTEPYSSIQDQQALMAWIKKQRLQSLLTLQWQTMNALNKERLIAGKPPLPGTQVFLKTSIRLRNGTNSQE